MRRILIALYVVSAIVLVFIMSPLSPLVVPVFYTTSYSSDLDGRAAESSSGETAEIGTAGDYVLFDTVKDVGQEAEVILTGQVMSKERRKITTSNGKNTTSPEYMAYIINVFDVAKGDLEQDKWVVLLQEWGESSYYDYPLEKEGIFLLVDAPEIKESGQYYRLVNPEQGFIGVDFEEDHISYIHMTDDIQAVFCDAKKGDGHRLTFRYIWNELTSIG